MKEIFVEFFTQIGTILFFSS